MKDKVWSRPKLVVLMRNKPEEAVLQVCKGLAGYGGPGPNHTNCAWMDNPTGAPNCVLGDCHGQVAT